MKRILAMILAGGRVDELKVLTLNRPKSTVPYGGMYRIIDFPLSNLMHSGIEKVGVLSQYHSASLVRHIGIGSSWDMVGRDRGAMVLPPFKSEQNSDWYRGTADAVFQNIDFIDEFQPDLVLVLSGDHVYHMNYQALIDYHLTKQADVTAVFKEVPIHSAHRFGLATIDKEDGMTGGRITAYHEKPANPKSTWASLTIYLFNTNLLKKILLELIQSSESFEFGHDILPRMVKSYRTYGYKFYGYWAYSRTIKEFWQANMDLLSDHSPVDLKQWEVRTNLDHRNLRDRTPTIISDSAEIHNSIIYTGCVVKGQVSDSVIFPGVIIEEGAKITKSIIMFDSSIKKNCVIDRSILDTDIIVNENCQIGCAVEDSEYPGKHDADEITVIGQSTIIPQGRVIGKNCIINPFMKADQFKDNIVLSGKQ
ncbi:MAG TPA: sugar phosphate nucleotidyltransferase [bacterium]